MRQGYHTIPCMQQSTCSRCVQSTTSASVCDKFCEKLLAERKFCSKASGGEGQIIHSLASFFFFSFFLRGSGCIPTHISCMLLTPTL